MAWPFLNNKEAFGGYCDGNDHDSEDSGSGSRA